MVWTPRLLRVKRAGNSMPDPNRWQEYFENLYHLVREFPADQARARTELWRLPSP
ncbi:hypothetical protein [Streptomyces torulosus]|uniref:hypothetical protein n=1 Tax=Streptomyces torulosus TaxID=68276 RepID=UPI0012FEC366|nr:hypothetical protein [Streptomyces torulosus]